MDEIVSNMGLKNYLLAAATSFILSVLPSNNYSYAQEIPKNNVRTEQISQEKEKRYNSELIGYKILELEEKLGPDDGIDYDKARKCLDEIIEKADDVFLPYNFGRTDNNSKLCEDAEVIFFVEVDNILKDLGYVYDNSERKNYLANDLIRKKMICTTFTQTYLTLAEKYDLPVYQFLLRGHTTVRFVSGETHTNWEVTAGHFRSDRMYKIDFMISSEAEKNGVYLRSLSKEESLSLVYNSMGSNYLNHGDFVTAAEMFYEAIKKNPLNVTPNYNMGILAFYLGDRNTALDCFDQVLKLDPLFTDAHEKVFDICKEQGKTEQSAKYYAKFKESMDNFKEYVKQFQKEMDAKFKETVDESDGIPLWVKILAVIYGFGIIGGLVEKRLKRIS